MVRYLHKILKQMSLGYFNILIRGIPRGLKKYLREIFLGKRKKLIIKQNFLIKYIIFSNKFTHTMTQRAIKRRIRKRFKVL